LEWVLLKKIVVKKSNFLRELFIAGKNSSKKNFSPKLFSFTQKLLKRIFLKKTQENLTWRMIFFSVIIYLHTEILTKICKDLQITKFKLHYLSRFTNKVPSNLFKRNRSRTFSLGIASDFLIMASFTSVGISHIIARNSGDAHLIRFVSTNWLIDHRAQITDSVSG